MDTTRIRFLALCCWMAGLLIGCTDDGEDMISRPSAGPASESVHQPFAEENCTACHQQAKSKRLRSDWMGSCSDCHADYFTQRVGHEPVAEGKCRECHTMHRSRYPDLLKSSLYATCMKCHKSIDRLSPEPHRVDDVQNCSRCHDPHFGGKGLLRVQPAT